jgi:protein arginine kinase
MTLDDLTKSSGEWLRGTGPESDIVMCSRIRLARNLADFPFTNRASRSEKTEIEAHFRAAMAHARLDLAYLDVNGLSALDRQFLVERQLISRELASSEGPRGVAIGPLENISIMVNEEDHLRIQVMLSGLSLQDVWERINRLDDELEEHLAYAYSPQLGYLTACPTNVGTGIRVGVMLHLPALVQTKQIDKVFRALQKINLAVRGLYGEGTQAFGDFYQISNQQTLGKSEQEVIRILTEVVPQVIQYERTARQALMNERRQHLHDQVSRAYGVLKTAHTISSEETMHLLSSVRMGINLGLIDDLAISTVNELFIQTQPAYLQKIQGSELGADERNVARASYLRSRLANGRHTDSESGAVSLRLTGGNGRSPGAWGRSPQGKPPVAFPRPPSGGFVPTRRHEAPRHPGTGSKSRSHSLPDPYSNLPAARGIGAEKK